MKFRKKPVIVEAVQWTGYNTDEVRAFIGDGGHVAYPHVIIHTREGVMTGSLCDWIIRGVAGEYYPCRDSIFRATYEAVE